MAKKPTPTKPQPTTDPRFACPLCTASPCVCPPGTGGSR